MNECVLVCRKEKGVNWKGEKVKGKIDNKWSFKS